MRLIASIFVVVVSAFAQQPAAFEVASIKVAEPPNPSMMRTGQMHIGTKVDNARADFGYASLSNLITFGYDLKAFQVVGPDWLTSTTFDILAKLPDGSTKEQAPAMMQTLLAERFKLSFHRDSKEFAVYVLVVGKDGPKLAAKPEDWEPNTKSNIRPMTVDTMTSLFTAMLDKPVINQTELKGDYMVQTDVLMKATVSMVMARAKSASGMTWEGASEPSGVDAFTIAQSLGLKLEARKMPLPLLIVDHMEKAPTEN